MKQRIVSALVGLLLLALVLSQFETLLLNAAISVIAMLAVWEFFHATKIDHNKALLVLGLVAALLIPFIPRAEGADLLPIVILPYIGLLFCVLLATHRSTHVEQAAMTFMMSLAIPLSLASAVYFRDWYGTTMGLFYLILSLGGAWFTDTGAYFVGCSIGKHKMCPEISPKKTWEGAVGGVVVCVLCMLLVGKLFEFFVPGFCLITPRLLILAPLASVTSMIGDLSASLVKRQFGIKDFGNIMPGHGGVLDRFDSVLFVMPLVWGFVQTWPIAIMN